MADDSQPRNSAEIDERIVELREARLRNVDETSTRGGRDPIAPGLQNMEADVALPSERNLNDLPAAFPNLISGPFHDGLILVFAVSAALGMIAAVISLMRGSSKPPAQTEAAVTRLPKSGPDPVGLDYWIWPGQALRLGSFPSDHFGCLPAGAPSARQLRGAGPA